MNVFALWHNDSQDYYVHTHDLLGLFTTREKALASMKSEVESKNHRGHLHPAPWAYRNNHEILNGKKIKPGTCGDDCYCKRATCSCDLYFEIEEIEVK